MTQQVINVGDNPNSKTGDPLRTAFIKINENFNEVYSALTDGVNFAQVNSDWNATTGVARILNKPTIPSNTNQLTNGSGFITSSDIPPIPADIGDLTDTQGLLGETDRLIIGNKEVILTGGDNPYVTFPAIASGDQLYIQGSEIASASGNLALTSRGNVYVISNAAGVNSLSWVFDTSGTILTSSLFPRTFTATCDNNHAVAQSDDDEWSITGDPWYFEVEFGESVDGREIIVTITNDTPWAENPGYVNGRQFQFTLADHGIPNYLFTLTLVSIQNPGPMMWTTNLEVSQAPSVPATLSSSSIKLKAGSNSLVFGLDGNLHLPLGGDILDSTGTSVLGGTISVGNGVGPSVQQVSEILFNGTVTEIGPNVVGVSIDPTIPNTIKGFINLVGNKPNNSDDIWFESVVVRSQYAYVLGGDYYIDNSDNRSKIYKFDLQTGEQVWVKQITAGRGSLVDLIIGSGVVTLDSISAGTGYKVGEEIVIPGYQIGGDQPANNVTIIVDTIDESGGILTASVKPGYDVTGITGTFSYTSDYDDARGNSCAISYDDFNEKLVVTSQYNSGRGNFEDGFWEWANVYVIDPVTGVVNQTVTLSEDGDIYPNSIATHNALGGVAVVGEKYNEYREFGPLTFVAAGNEYFDILKSDLDPEHYPGAPFNNYYDFWITGTGITGQENVDGVNQYSNLSSTTREGSGAGFTVTVNHPTVLATITTSDLATATAGGTIVKNVDNIVTPGGWGNWLVFPDSALRVTLESIFTMNEVIPVNWLAGSTSLNGYIMIQFPGDGTFQITPVEEGGGNAIAGTWYFDVDLLNNVAGSTYSVIVTAGGTNYLPGHKVKVLGSALGGTTPENDLIITVDGLTEGAISNVSNSGTANAAAIGPYTNVSGTNYNVGNGVVIALGINPSTGAPGGPLTVFPYGTDYVEGDVLTIAGTNFVGGTSPANDITITVGSVVNNGEISSLASMTGTGPTNALRIRVDGVDFTAVGGSWNMRQNLGGEAFVWTPAWTNAIGGPTGDRFYDVCWKEDGTALYAVGRGVYEVDYNQALVVKFNATTGAVVWSKDIKFSEAAGNSREARAVCVIPGSTDILVAGGWYNFDNSGGTDEIILTRMTDAGVAVWQKTYSPEAQGNTQNIDFEISLKATNNAIVVSFEQSTNGDSRGLAYMVVDPTNGSVIRHRVVSSDGNSNYNYYNTPTANFADIYTDAEGDHIVMAGKTYVPTDYNYNALLMRLPLDGVVDIDVDERWSLGEHIMNRHTVNVTTVTPAFDSFTPEEHVNTITVLNDARNYSTRTPDGLLNVWTHKITDDAAGYLEFGDGSKQSFATDIIPQIPASNDYWLTAQDSGKHIFFEDENGTVYIPHRDVRYFPVGFTFTIVNTTGNDCYLRTNTGNTLAARLKLAGRNIDTENIGIPDSGSGSMVTVMKIKDGYVMSNSDNDADYPDVWIVSGPGDLYNND